MDLKPYRRVQKSYKRNRFRLNQRNFVAFQTIFSIPLKYMISIDIFKKEE